MSVADRIRTLRKQKLRWTQEQFGASAGVSKQAVSQWEHGVTIPDRDALRNIRHKLKISDDWILHGTEPMTVASLDLIAEKSAPYNVSALPPDIQRLITLFNGLTENQQIDFMIKIEEQHKFNDQLLAELLTKRDSD